MPIFVTADTNPIIANDIRSWMLEANPVAIATALKAMANRRDSKVILPNITVPSLLIASDRDRVTRSTAIRKMASELKGFFFR